MTVNPKQVSWTNPTTFTDGTAYAPTDNVGYTIQLDSTPAISIPLVWGSKFDLTTLAQYKALTRGTHTVSVAAVSKEDGTSDFGTPATFQVSAKPSAPSSIQVS